MFFEMQTIAFIVIFHKIVVSSGESSPFGYCLQQKPSPGVFACMGRQALTALQNFEESDNFTITSGLVAVRQETGISRSLPNFVDQDPTDLRGMLENAGVMVSQRSLQWDLSRVYPGLQMKIGPSFGSMGVLEFIMDKGNERGDDRTYLSEEPSTARILTKQFVLPFLLGLKFNMMTLLPLVIAAIIFVSKKAAFLGKIALMLSGLFSTGTLFSLSSIFAGGGHGGGHDHHYGFHRPVYQGGYKEYDSQHTHHQHHDDENLSPGYYKNLHKDTPDQQQQQQQIIDNFYDYEKKVLLRDRISKLYERELNDETSVAASRNARQLDTQKQPATESQSSNSYRNFAWQTQQQN